MPFTDSPLWFFSTSSTVHVAAASTLMFDMFNAMTSPIRVVHIEHVVNLETAVTGVGFRWQLLRTTAVGTGGTGLTAWGSDTIARTSDATQVASVTARLKATGGATASTSLKQWWTNSEETLAGNQLFGGIAGFNVLPAILVQRGGIVLRQNQGIRINQETNSVAGNSAFLSGIYDRMTDDDIIDAILLREGGYVDHPNDKGGPTNYGITLGTLNDWRQSIATADDVKTLTEDEARIIYRSMYVEKPGFDKIPSPELRALLIDAGVQHGTKKAIQFLQRALGILDDGVIGDVTLTALPHLQPQSLGIKIMAERLKYYVAIVKHDPTQKVFLAGWVNRCIELIEGLA